MAKKLYCPNCNKEIKEDWNYCLHCGDNLNKYTYCSKCGKPILKSDDFCVYCGTLNEDYDPIKYDEPNDNFSTKTKFFKVLAVIALFIMYVFGIVKVVIYASAGSYLLSKVGNFNTSYKRVSNLFDKVNRIKEFTDRNSYYFNTEEENALVAAENIISNYYENLNYNTFSDLMYASGYGEYTDLVIYSLGLQDVFNNNAFNCLTNNIMADPNLLTMVVIHNDLIYEYLSEYRYNDLEIENALNLVGQNRYYYDFYGTFEDVTGAVKVRLEPSTASEKINVIKKNEIINTSLVTFNEGYMWFYVESYGGWCANDHNQWFTPLMK